jgi:hypothetical protein
MIFLSASIPDPRRNEKYYGTADLIAIRDAVRALATVVVPHSVLVWGGHPAITPLIRYVMDTMRINIQEHVTLYQSEYFRNLFPDENKYFEKLIITPANHDRESSLYDMRKTMLSNNFKAAFFIGGMEGVEEEYNLFKELHPNVSVFPIASTGAAAKIIYDKITPKLSERLLSDLAFMSLFRNLLEGVI